MMQDRHRTPNKGLSQLLLASSLLLIVIVVVGSADATTDAAFLHTIISKNNRRCCGSWSSRSRTAAAAAQSRRVTDAAHGEDHAANINHVINSNTSRRDHGHANIIVQQRRTRRRLSLFLNSHAAAHHSRTATTLSTTALKASTESTTDSTGSSDGSNDTATTAALTTEAAGVTAADDDEQRQQQTTAARRELARTADHLKRMLKQQKRQKTKSYQIFQVMDEDGEDESSTGSSSVGMGKEGMGASSQQRQRSIQKPPDPLGDERERVARDVYMRQSANALQGLLRDRGLPHHGRKPDLARRLAEHDLCQHYGDDDAGDAMKIFPISESASATTTRGSSSSGEQGDHDVVGASSEKNDKDIHISTDDDDPRTGTTTTATSFAGLAPLSDRAARALSRAQFDTPTPIQREAIPRIWHGQSCILHAETGSGKTLTYLLPLTEQLWAERTLQQESGNPLPYVVIMTPTRELAAQVAGIAMELAPPSTVRFVSRPTNLMALDDAKERTGGGAVVVSEGRDQQPRIYIGSAKAIMTSLYGDGGKQFTVPPTSKPEAMDFMQHVGCVVIDEVDRLLDIKSKGATTENGGSSRKRKNPSRQHEKPAAIVASAVTRLTLGQAQIIAASATVGRPLKRELARVLGLIPQECPPIVRGSDDHDHDGRQPKRENNDRNAHVGRAVTIPDTVKHYLVPVAEGRSAGKLLTTAYQVIQQLNVANPDSKMLLVLTRNFGMNTANVVGALQHFQCRPEPQSLLDALELGLEDGGTDEMIEAHRAVSGAEGIGESSSAASSPYFDPNEKETEANDKGEDEKEKNNTNAGSGSSGYLLVTGEDTIRGLHIDGLDVVIMVGHTSKSNGPDEYVHIAGRTGRAGRTGKVITVAATEHTDNIASWSKMLDVQFQRITSIQDDIAKL